MLPLLLGAVAATDVTLLCRHTLEELEGMVETARQSVPGVDAAIAAAIDRKDNPVWCTSRIASRVMLLYCRSFSNLDALMCTQIKRLRGSAFAAANVKHSCITCLFADCT